MRELQRKKNYHITLFQTQMVETLSRFVAVYSYSAVKKTPYGVSIQIPAAFLYYLFGLVSFPMSRFFF